MLSSYPKKEVTEELMRHTSLFRCVSLQALFTSELLRQEQAKLNEARKISVVNVNPTNIRPHSDTPEIRKYKKRFNSEILCAALWGKRLVPPCPRQSSPERVAGDEMSGFVPFSIPGKANVPESPQP